MTLRNGSTATLWGLLDVVMGVIFLSGCGGGSGGGGSTPPPPEPNVSLSIRSLTFPQMDEGSTSSAQSVTLSNTGDASLSISSISITGADHGDFAETNTCGSSVVASDECTISVTFTPSALGSRTAAVSVTDNASGSPQTVSLSGIAVAPAVSLSPTNLTFASQTVGTASG